MDGKSLVLNIDKVKYAFTLAPNVTGGATLLTLSSANTKIENKDDVTVSSGPLKNLAAGNKVYLLTSGTLTVKDNNTQKVTLPGIRNTFTGTVAQDGNRLALTIDKAEPLTYEDVYPYVIVVKKDETPKANAVTVPKGETAAKNAIGAYVEDKDNTEPQTGKAVNVEGTVIGYAAGASSSAGNVEASKADVASGATVKGFVAGGVTESGDASGNAAAVNGTVTGNAYGGYTETGAASGNTLTMTNGTVEGNAYGSYSESGTAGGGTATLTNSTVKGDLYGSSGKTSTGGSTITLTNSTVGGTIYGSSASETTTVVSSNTMNIHRCNTADNVENIGTYNFYLPAGAKAGDVLLHLTTNKDTDMKGSTVNVRADGSTNLRDAETVYLIKKDGGRLLTDTTINQSVAVFVGVTAKLTGTVTNEDNKNLVLTTKAAPVSNSGGSSSSGGSGSSGGSSSSSASSNTNNAESASSISESSSSGSSSSARTPRVTINPDTKSDVAADCEARVWRGRLRRVRRLKRQRAHALQDGLACRCAGHGVQCGHREKEREQVWHVHLGPVLRDGTREL